MAFSKTVRSFRAALVVVGTAALLVACGGEEDGSNSGTDNGTTDPNISATPAFLSRSCDGQQSPQLFCPNTNGG